MDLKSIAAFRAINRFGNVLKFSKAASIEHRQFYFL